MLNAALLLRLQQATGLDLSRAAVSAAVRQRMKDRATADQAAYAQRALHDTGELDALIDLLVVPETWFFRDAEAFTAAVALVQHKLASGQGRSRALRLLSIPCASGEEPGSLAMALLDAGVSAQAFTIEAVDISRQVLARARRGLYSRNAFRTADLSFRERHFSHSPEGYTLSAAVRAQVQTSCGNLLTLEPPPGQAFDLIFCRNLLIYFDAATQRAAIRKLHALLADDGLLFAGYAETAVCCQHGFALAPFPKAFALQKAAAPHAPALAPLQRPKRRAAPAPTAPAVPMPAAASARSAQRTPAPVPAPPAAPGPDAPALLRQAARLADAGQPDEARTQYQAYLKICPDSVQAHFMLSLLHAQDSAAAEACLRRALYLDPQHYEALCHLALLSEHAGRAREAVRLRQRAARVFARRPTPSTQGNR